ncbi:hypothetical protein [Brevundimonas lenta]|uniref:DUF2188 domain-containing protein n=1 Tax=Brevundimonas lenta TaxID=424796 RepID=A0A7W6JBB6_9CAUL|nr:hypothetical protein [Brevundimonas lenta]MBB4081969.1 hypothetical protein [Brevundimonas lenta]
MIPPPEPAPVPIEISHDHGLWRFRSLDGRLSGSFLEHRAALRAAEDEANSHGCYVVVRAPG